MSISSMHAVPGMCQDPKVSGLLAFPQTRAKSWAPAAHGDWTVSYSKQESRRPASSVIL